MIFSYSNIEFFLNKEKHLEKANKLIILTFLFNQEIKKLSNKSCKV